MRSEVRVVYTSEVRTAVYTSEVRTAVDMSEVSYASQQVLDGWVRDSLH